MGDPRLASDQADETYYARFLPVFLLIALLAGILCFGALLLTEGGDFDLIAVAFAIGVLVFAGAMQTRRLISAYPVYIGPEGVRVYGLRGGPSIDAHWLKWPDITRVSRFYFPFVRCLVFRTRGSKRRYWIPLDLVNGSRFKDQANNYAGRAHPLTRALFGQ